MTDKPELAFFVVWNPRNGPPTYRHMTKAAAEAEAERLARCNPGHEFSVLCALSKAQRSDVRVTRFHIFDADIPS